jgi:hypothetical protein
MQGKIGAPDQPVIVETAPISDIFVEGIARIEKIRSCIRFHLYVTERDPDGDEIQVVVAKLVCPLDIVPQEIRQVLEAMRKTDPLLLS